MSKLSADGAHLIYSTYLGGSINDAISGLAVDGQGNAYVTGVTHVRGLPDDARCLAAAAGQRLLPLAVLHRRVRGQDQRGRVRPRVLDVSLRRGRRPRVRDRGRRGRQRVRRRHDVLAVLPGSRRVPAHEQGPRSLGRVRREAECGWHAAPLFVIPRRQRRHEHADRLRRGRGHCHRRRRQRLCRRLHQVVRLPDDPWRLPDDHRRRRLRLLRRPVRRCLRREDHRGRTRPGDGDPCQRDADRSGAGWHPDRDVGRGPDTDHGRFPPSLRSRLAQRNVRRLLADGRRRGRHHDVPASRRPRVRHVRDPSAEHGSGFLQPAGGGGSEPADPPRPRRRRPRGGEHRDDSRPAGRRTARRGHGHREEPGQPRRRRLFRGLLQESRGRAWSRRHRRRPVRDRRARRRREHAVHGHRHLHHRGDVQRVGAGRHRTGSGGIR